LCVCDMVTHPGGSNGFGKVVVAIRPGVTLAGHTPFPSGSELKLINGAALLSTSGNELQNRFVTNWNMNGISTLDEWMGVENITLNGNCANVGSSTVCNDGIQFWKSRHVRINNVVVENMRGENGGPQETFHIDSNKCEDFVVTNSIVLCNDGGNTASGIASSYTNRIRVNGCTVLGMTTANGLTFNCCGGFTIDNTYIGDCISGSGFNFEHSWDGVISNIISGAPSATLDVTTSPGSYTPGQAHGNDKGLIINFQHGGGNLLFDNCDIRGSITRGVGVLGANIGTAAAGTTGTTVVGPAGFFYPGMVGRYLQVGTGAFVKITGYTSGTTVTTEAHGGASGQTINLLSGNVKFRNSRISDTSNAAGTSGNGFQVLDTLDTVKRLTIRTCDLTDVTFDNNFLDMAGVGNGTGNGAVTLASGKAVATLTDNMVTATEYFNPFPKRMRVMNLATGATVGVTSIRTGHPKAVLTSTGTSTTVPFDVPVGGSILINNTVMSNVSWWFIE
jgi:hypothetical protein